MRGPSCCLIHTCGDVRQHWWLRTRLQSDFTGRSRRGTSLTRLGARTCRWCASLVCPLGWTLYFNFNLTHVRLQQSVFRSTRSLPSGNGAVSEASSSSSAAPAKDQSENFFIKNRHLTSTPFLLVVNVAVFLVLMIAPAVLTATHPSIKEQFGDGCSQAWGPVVLAAYVAAYVLVFSWFSFSLRSVVDGFRIKSELKGTGLIALIAVIPWSAQHTRDAAALGRRLDQSHCMHSRF